MASRTAATAKKTAPAKATPAKGKGQAKALPVRDEWKTNVDERKVNAQVLAEELRARGLDARGSTMACVRRLERHICTNAGSVRLAACDCGGRSLVTDKRCPYCGSADEVITDEQEKPNAAVTPVPESAVRPVEPAAAGAEKADAARSAHYVVSDDSIEPVGQSDAEEDEEALPTGAVPVLSGEVVVVDGDPEEPEGEAGAIVPVKPTMSDEDALAASAGLQPTPDEVQDLDRRVARVRELEVAFQVTGWDLGNELNEINSGKLFLARRLGSGAPKYRSFAAFVEAELNLDNSNARKFMAVAAKYTREQVLAHGMSKMLLVVQIPEGARDAILSDGAAMALPVRGLREVTQLVRGGADPKAAVAQVTQNREAAKAYTPAVPAPDAEEAEDESEIDEPPTGSDEGKPAPGPKAAPAPAAPPKAKATPAREEDDEDDAGEKPTLGELFVERKATPVEVITVPGRFQMKFYARPKNGALGKKRRAFTIQEQPRATFKFQNGAELRIGLHAGPSGIYAVCEMTPPEG